MTGLSAVSSQPPRQGSGRGQAVADVTAPGQAYLGQAVVDVTARGRSRSGVTAPGRAVPGQGFPGQAAPGEDGEDPVGWATPARGAPAGGLRPRDAPGRGAPARRKSPARAGRSSGARSHSRGRGRRRGAHLPYLLVLTAALGGLAWMWQGGTQQPRGGTLAVAVAMFAAAFARLVLPEERAGMLASRGRFIDVVTLAALATGLLVAGLVLPTPS